MLKYRYGYIDCKTSTSSFFPLFWLRKAPYFCLGFKQAKLNNILLELSSTNWQGC